MTKRLSMIKSFKSCCSGDFTDDELEIIFKISKALGNEARLEIYRYLNQINSCMTSQLVDHLPLAQSTISQHLKVLKEAGVIVGEIEGTTTNYCIDTKLMKIYYMLLGRLI